MFQQGKATLGEMAAGQIGQSASAYGSRIADAAPRELGLMERLDGVASGLDEVNRRLGAVCARIVGHGGPGENSEKKEPAPIGMPVTLSLCEQRIRSTLAIIEAMERTF